MADRFEKELARLREAGLKCIEHSDFIKAGNNFFVHVIDVDLTGRIAVDDKEPAFVIPIRLMTVLKEIRDIVNKDITLLRILEK